MATTKTCTTCDETKPLADFNRSRRHKGYNHRCKVCTRRAVNESRLRNNDTARARQRERYAERRNRCLAAYGNECACCTERRSVFLTIDHVNDDGADHRATLPFAGTAGVIYVWLIKNNFPSGFQVLCHNCNYAKSQGTCPHQMRMLRAAEFAALL